MKKFFADFKTFITKGNILDLAVAVIIGGAFGKIITSLVNDIIMPLVSLAVGGTSVSEWKWIIKEAVYDNTGVLMSAESALTYGIFLQTVLDFLIIAFCIFILIRIVMRMRGNVSTGVNGLKDKDRKTFIKQLKAEKKTRAEIDAAILEREAKFAEEQKILEEVKKAEEEAARPRTSEELLIEIRDILKERTEKV